MSRINNACDCDCFGTKQVPTCVCDNWPFSTAKKREYSLSMLMHITHIQHLTEQEHNECETNGIRSYALYTVLNASFLVELLCSILFCIVGCCVQIDAICSFCLLYNRRPVLGICYAFGWQVIELIRRGIKLKESLAAIYSLNVDWLLDFSAGIPRYVDYYLYYPNIRSGP